LWALLYDLYARCLLLLTMKSYFVRLFNYDKWANKQINELLQIYTGNDQRPVKLMAHLLVAQQTWLKRCMALTAPGSPLWPEWNVNSFDAIIDNNTESYLEFLNRLHSDDFDSTITYKNSLGETFNNTLSDILQHVINHGTHHRAQIGVYLKAAGVNLPATDYILYIRNLDKQHL
jgi:uncharacterized damage-inducible protein DinB